MEKVFWVYNTVKLPIPSPFGRVEDLGLDEVNHYLAQGWTVKHISAGAIGTSAGGQAYIVLEKKDY